MKELKLKDVANVEVDDRTFNRTMKELKLKILYHVDTSDELLIAP